MTQQSTKPFSKIGIASFLFSVLCIGAIFFLILGLIIGGNPGLITAYASFIVASVSSIIGFLSGIAVFFMKKTRRVFGVIGFFLSLFEITLIGLSIFLSIKFFEFLGIALGSGFGKM